jgi:UDP-glucose 4-epimerase
MDKVVVIGGSGFMGSHAADELTSRGYAVTILDVVSSPWLSEKQEMIVGDILDESLLNQVLDGAKYVYHFAGIADIAEAKERPYDTLNLNIMGTVKILEAAVKAKVDRIIYASTMYVYSPYGSFYRASKQSAETIIEAYHEAFGLDFTVLRYGSLYGPRAQEWNGLKRYVSQLVQCGKLDYWGSGNERREYIHAIDAARLSVDILDAIHANKAITVTGQQVLKSDEMIDLLFEITGNERAVNYIVRDDHHGHYTSTPYRYTPKQAKKLVPDEFIDLGEGILELVEELHRDADQSFPD